MNLDADKTMTRDCFFNHRLYTPCVPLRINERESVEAIRAASDNPRDSAISDCVIGVKRREEHGSIDPRSRSTQEIFCEWRIGVPWTSESITLPCMTVTINNHGHKPSGKARTRGSAHSKILELHGEAEPRRSAPLTLGLGPWSGLWP